MGLVALTIYGVGDILGAGIYALIGEIVGAAGSYGWLSFAIAMFVAGLTGLAYAELGSRYPVSAGESYFCDRAFGRPVLSILIGWLVFCSGLISLATISRAFAEYFGELLPGLPAEFMIVGLISLLGVINFIGIRMSSGTNIVCTLIEILGLVIVLATGFLFLSSLGEAPGMAEPGEFSWSRVLRGSTLAFFAFIGFEDMVNVSEEVRAPERNMPRAIIIASVVTGVLYMLVVIVATRVVPTNDLADSGAPLLLAVQTAAPRFPLWLFSVIALFAVANTGLLNFITASRLVYGMSRHNLLPAWLGAVHPTTATPHRAIVVCYLTALLLALSGSLEALAGTTSLLLLSVFATMNASLLRIHIRRDPHDGFRIPSVIPLCGLCFCIGLVPFVPTPSLFASGVVVVIGLFLGNRRIRESG